VKVDASESLRGDLQFLPRFVQRRGFRESGRLKNTSVAPSSPNRWNPPSKGRPPRHGAVLSAIRMIPHRRGPFQRRWRPCPCSARFSCYCCKAAASHHPNDRCWRTNSGIAPQVVDSRVLPVVQVRDFQTATPGLSAGKTFPSAGSVWKRAPRFAVDRDVCYLDRSTQSFISRSPRRLKTLAHFMRPANRWVLNLGSLGARAYSAA